jgi:hypothetical protein
MEIGIEIWKDIPELNGKYQCSNVGRIRRINKDIRCEKYKYLKLQTNKKGYTIVNPTRNYRKSVHRIVAELFIENPYNKPFVNHKDLDKKNNNIYNLEWVTASENSLHAQENNKLGRMHILVKDSKTNIVYNSVKEASEKLLYPYKYASKMINKKGSYKNLVKIEKIYKTLS